jgi:hypothetical protein
MLIVLFLLISKRNKNTPAKLNLIKIIKIAGKKSVNIFIEITFTANIEVPTKAHKFQISIIYHSFYYILKLKLFLFYNLIKF